MLQTLTGLGVLVAGAELFVEGVIGVAEGIGLSPLVIALVLGPLVTEIPEKTNSVIWIREGKDTLAVGNVTGASLPIDRAGRDRAGLQRLGARPLRHRRRGGVLAGGLVAYLTLTGRKSLGLRHILAWGTLFAGFAVFAVTA